MVNGLKIQSHNTNVSMITLSHASISARLTCSLDFDVSERRVSSLLDWHSLFCPSSIAIELLDCRCLFDEGPHNGSHTILPRDH